MMMKNLQTARLRFRPLCSEDKVPLLEFFTDPVATEFLYLDGTFESMANLWVERQVHRYDGGAGGLFAVELKETGELLGQCGLLRQFVDGIPKWEIGYHFIRRHWGKGYATEAAIACRDFAFQNEWAETLISLIHPENYRSQAVARRNGMTPWKETIFKGYPATVFRIRRSEWEQLV